MVLVNRERWVIRRKDNGYLLCGLARDYHFCSPEALGDVSLKTYRSKRQALSAFDRSWGTSLDVEAVRVRETLEILDEEGV